MRAVHVGIGHDDDPVVAKLFDIKIFMDACPEGGDHRPDLGISEDPVQAGLLHVQDLAAERKDRLRRPGPGGLGGSACGVTLDDEDLAVLSVLVGAVRQLAGQAQSVQRALPAGQVPRLARGGPGSLRHHRLLYDQFSDLRVLFQVDAQTLAEQALHGAPRLGIAQFLLRLSLELGLPDLDGNDRGQTFTDIFSRQVFLALFQELLRPAVVIERLRQRVAEARQMRAALGRDDVVDKGIGGLVVAVVVLQRDLDQHAVLLALAVDDIVIQRGLALIQVLDKFPDSAFIVERPLFPRLHPLIGERDAESLCQERGLAQSLLERIKIIFKCLENGIVRQESDLGSGLLRITVADDLQVVHGIALLIALLIDLPLMEYLDLQVLGKRVDNGSADPVKAAGYLVSPSAELAARVQHGKYDLHRGLSCLLIDPDRNAAPVIDHCDRLIRVQVDPDMRTGAGQRLIHGIVHDLIDQVMQSSRGSGPDIHAGSLADSFQSFQYLYLIGTIFGVRLSSHISSESGIPVRRRRICT